MLKDHSCRVLENRPCGRDLKVLRLETDGSPFGCRAGQFVMLDLPDNRFFFRRPFSVLQTPSPTQLDIFYKVVGQGTRMMAALQPGQAVKCLGPLGNSFTTPPEPERALLIGGGIGIAPLYLLGRQLQEAGATTLPHCIYGARSEAELGLHAELRELFGEARLQITTDDGSAGFGGNVCQWLAAESERVRRATHAYICGPTPMMAATADLLRQMNPGIRVEVSLEEHMPCGTGACTGCVVPRADQFLPSKVCVEGPVFPAQAIRWNWSQSVACGLNEAAAMEAAAEVSACRS